MEKSFIYTYIKKGGAVCRLAPSLCIFTSFLLFFQAVYKQRDAAGCCGKHSPGTVLPTTELYKILDLYLNPIRVATTLSLFQYCRVCLKEAPLSLLMFQID